LLTATSTANVGEYLRPRVRSQREAQRAGCRADAAVAGAPVLLPLMLDEHESPLDDGDLLAVLGLPHHLTQRAAALRADPVGRGQLVHHLDGRQLRLRGPSVSAARCRRRGRLDCGAVRATLRRGAEQRALALREELFQEVEFVLRGEAAFAAEPREFRGEGLDLGVELLVLALEEHRDLTKHLRITDRIEPKHVRTTSSARAVSKHFRGVGDHERCG
jgi:hypothetical protein